MPPNENDEQSTQQQPQQPTTDAGADAPIPHVPELPPQPEPAVTATAEVVPPAAPKPAPEPAKPNPAGVVDQSAQPVRDPNNPGQPFPPANAPVQIKSVEEVLGDDEDTVTMLFPKQVILTTDKKERLVFDAGPQEVPASLADHWYLKANGVTKYDPRAAIRKRGQE